MLSWLSRFNPTPAFPPYTGPYDVGTVDIEIPTSELQPGFSDEHATKPTVAFRCFYPCQTPTKLTKPVYWVQSPQRSIIHAYSRFLGAGSFLATVFSHLSHLLYCITIPAIRNAPILPSPNPTKRWPVLVFSHGLGGSRNAYSHLCGSLASHGLVVFAPDHRDGSAPISHVQATEDTEAQTIDYHRFSHTPSPEVYNGRDEMLQMRISELSLLHAAILKIDNGENIRNLGSNCDKTAEDETILPMFHSLLDVHTPASITFGGHSFGAVTTVQFVKSIFYSDKITNPLLSICGTPTSALKSQITPNTPTILLDLWSLPINSPATAALKAQPMPCFAPFGPGGTPLLAILSEAFFKWRQNLNDVKNVIRSPSTTTDEKATRPSANIFYPIASAHLSQSDFGLVFPRLTKYLAKAAEPERTLRLNVRAILETLRRSGMFIAATSLVDMEHEIEVGVEKTLDSENVSGDWKILSREVGSVPGWIALNADAEEEVVERVEAVAEKVGDKKRSKSKSMAEVMGGTEMEGSALNGGKV